MFYICTSSDHIVGYIHSAFQDYTINSKILILKFMSKQVYVRR